MKNGVTCKTGKLYRKIPLIRFIPLILFIYGKKNTSICNLINLLLFFLFSSIKLVFGIFHAMQDVNMFKVNNNAPEYVK